jgi:hypothetical protein
VPCAIFEFGVWGNYFSEEDDVTVAVTSDRYCATLENFLWPKLDDLFDEHVAECLVSTRWRNSPRISSSTRNYQRNVSWACCLLAWPLRLPDLTPCEFFLWGYLKAQVYEHRPQTLEGLKRAITQEISDIPLEMTHRLMEKYRQKISASTMKAALTLDPIK